MKRRAFDQWPIANMGLRLAAQIIDQALVLVGTAMGLGFFFPQKISTTEWWLLLFFVWPLISLSAHSFFVFFMGTTPGKKAFGLKISNAKPNIPLSAWQVLSRQCVWWLGALSLGVGWTTILTRSDRRAWHDLVSETFVAAENKKAGSDSTAPVKLWQKTLGHGWAVGVSLIFFSFFTTIILFEFQKFDKKEGTQISAAIDALPNLESAAWLILIDQFDKTSIRYSDLTEEKLGMQVKLFIEAQKLAKKNRFEFYKTKMQGIEDSLCKQAQIKFCHSAQTLSAILSGLETKAANQEGVLSALKVLYKMERASAFEEKRQILQAELSHAEPNSTSYLALKAYLIRIHARRGEFERASAFVSLNKPNESDSIVDNLIAEKYYEYGCQVTAFSKCDNSAYTFCSDNKFWKDWSVGCQDHGDKSSNAAKLGYSWNLLLKSKMTYEDWNTQKAIFNKLTDEEKQITAAFDFVMNLENESPMSLVEKSRSMSLDNPLWGWAQTRAYKTYGSQWLALVNPSEQAQAEQYAIRVDNKLDRMIASSKKPSRKSSGGHHPAKKKRGQ